MDFIVSPATVLAIVAVQLCVAYLFVRKQTPKGNTKLAPGPMALPWIGNLLDMIKFEKDPFAGFTEMAKKFGSVFSLKLGSTPCVVVSSFEGMKEVLIKKGNIFDQRPNFMRWNAYFDGDRQQSLALCDWSDIQKTRRNVVRSFLILRQKTTKFDALDSTVTTEMGHLIDAIDQVEGQKTNAKLPISYCALNVFLGYMCSVRYEYSHEGFQKLTKSFDQIFDDINNGHPTDFLPWLAPFFKSYKSEVSTLAKTIRQFILDEIIKDRPQNFDGENINDLVDALLSNYMNSDDGKLSLDWQNILFALEDLLGGSSAISNIVMRVLAHMCQHPEAQRRFQQEIDAKIQNGRLPELEDRSDMPFAEAIILETLRMTSSPIVPHVASEDTSIDGFSVSKGTVVMLNNYALDNSSELWECPEKFNPERFIKNGSIKKPAHFMPFSTGKRSCIGSRILMNVTFSTVATLLQRYDVSLPENVNITLPKGKLSLDCEGFPMIFSSRNNNNV